jgi:hypothetical protein
VYVPDDQKNSLVEQAKRRVQKLLSPLDEENPLVEHEIVRDQTTNAPVDLAIFIDYRRRRLQEKRRCIRLTRAAGNVQRPHPFAGSCVGNVRIHSTLLHLESALVGSPPHME